jgi:hypothetical protein
VYCVDGQLLGITSVDGTLVVSAVRPSGVFELASIPDIPADFRVAPVGGRGGNELTVLWDAAPPRAASGGARYEILSISASTGRVLFRGPAATAGPVSRNEVRLLTGGLLCVMAAVLVFVLWPGQGGEEDGNAKGIPQGFVAAGVWRRVSASALDLGLAGLIAAYALRSLVSIELGELGAGVEWIYLGAILATGWVISVITEAFFGRTPGKVLAGCRVVVGRFSRRKAGDTAGINQARDRPAACGDPQHAEVAGPLRTRDRAGSGWPAPGRPRREDGGGSKDERRCSGGRPQRGRGLVSARRAKTAHFGHPSLEMSGR